MLCSLCFSERRYNAEVFNLEPHEQGPVRTKPKLKKPPVSNGMYQRFPKSPLSAVDSLSLCVGAPLDCFSLSLRS